jgi:hypothetical protein
MGPGGAGTGILGNAGRGDEDAYLKGPVVEPSYDAHRGQVLLA